MDEEKRTVWCGNLSDRVTEEVLYEFFLQAAPLERVHIPTDKEGRKSNFAFVTMKHEASVDYAVQLLNGIPLFDRRINIKPRGRTSQNNNANNNNNSNMQNRGQHDNNSFMQQQREPESSINHGNFHPPRELLDFSMTPQRGRGEQPQDFGANNDSSRHRVQETNQDYGQVIHELLEMNNLLKFPNSYDDMNRSFDSNNRPSQRQNYQGRNHRRNNNKPYSGDSNPQFHHQNKRDSFNGRDNRRQQHNQGNNSRGFKEKGWRYRN